MASGPGVCWPSWWALAVGRTSWRRLWLQIACWSPRNSYDWRTKQKPSATLRQKRLVLCYEWSGAGFCAFFSPFFPHVLTQAQWQAYEHLHTIEVLFKDRGIFAGDQTYTQKTCANLASIGAIRYQEGKSERVGAIPQGSMEELYPVCRTIADVHSAFFAAHFPGFEQMNAYSAFDLETTLTWEQRRELMNIVASQEKVPPEDLWTLSSKTLAVCFFAIYLLHIYTLTVVFFGALNQEATRWWNRFCGWALFGAICPGSVLLQKSRHRPRKGQARWPGKCGLSTVRQKCGCVAPSPARPGAARPHCTPSSLQGHPEILDDTHRHSDRWAVARGGTTSWNQVTVKSFGELRAGDIRETELSMFYWPEVRPCLQPRWVASWPGG